MGLCWRFMMNINFTTNFTLNKPIITKAIMLYIFSYLVLYMTNIIYIFVIVLLDGTGSEILAKDPSKIIPITLGIITAIAFGIIFGKSARVKNSKKENHTILAIILLIVFFLIAIYFSFTNKILVFKDNLMWNYQIQPDQVIWTNSLYFKTHFIELIAAPRITIQALILYSCYFIVVDDLLNLNLKRGKIKWLIK